MKQQNNLYSQNKIAEILGVSHSTFSKWLKDNEIKPKQISGQRKLYSKTVIEQFSMSKKKPSNNGVRKQTTVELLQGMIDSQKQEIEYLRTLLKERDQQIKNKDKVIADFGSRLATLADQAQKLNLADKKPAITNNDAERTSEKASSPKLTDDSPKVTLKSRHWWNFFKS